MFCDQCGKPQSNGAKFCSACGARLNAASPSTSTLPYATTSAPRIAPDEAILTLRPVFMAGPTIAAVVPITAFMTFWAGGFCGGFSMFGLQFISRYTGLKLPQGVTFIFFGLLAFFGIPFVTYFGRRKSYQKTEYRFYADRLEYYEGFFNVQQKVVDYRHVLEVNLTKGIMQRRYGLGTIVLATAASVGNNNRFTGAGIRVADIANPDEIFEQVRTLVHESQERTARV